MMVLFPAWAGVTPIDETDKKMYGAFPRMGGGDPNDKSWNCWGYIFSPHGRG